MCILFNRSNLGNLAIFVKLFGWFLLNISQDLGFLIQFVVSGMQFADLKFISFNLSYLMFCRVDTAETEPDLVYERLLKAGPCRCRQYQQQACCRVSGKRSLQHSPAAQLLHGVGRLEGARGLASLGFSIDRSIDRSVRLSYLGCINAFGSKSYCKSLNKFMQIINIFAKLQ